MEGGYELVQAESCANPGWDTMRTPALLAMVRSGRAIADMHSRIKQHVMCERPSIKRC